MEDFENEKRPEEYSGMKRQHEQRPGSLKAHGTLEKGHTDGLKNGVGVGDKVRNISGCFIKFILDFIKKNGEA